MKKTKEKKKKNAKAPKTRAGSAALDRPFDQDVWSTAARLVSGYQFILWQEDGEWHGRGIELPLVFGGGPTPGAAADDVIEALRGTVAHMIERGEAPPTPASSGARTEQVNVRLSALEKETLEAGAKRRGYKGLADFLRAAAVDFAR